MQPLRTIPTCAILTGALAVIAASAARADVTIQERVAISGAGLMRMANMNGTTTTRISGQRARTESELRFESGVMRTFARGAGESTEIVRLDQDKLYSVDAIDPKSFEPPAGYKKVAAD